jgi:aspartate/methionine/tyrosine aminotransferase
LDYANLLNQLVTDGGGYQRSIVNEAAAASPFQPIVNMGQGFFGYNPPQFVLDAAKRALDQVDCNQYSPTKASRLAGIL